MSWFPSSKRDLVNCIIGSLPPLAHYPGGYEKLRRRLNRSTKATLRIIYKAVK